MFIPELVRREGLRRGLRPKTIKTYQQCLKQFFTWTSKDPKCVTRKDVEGYMDMLIAEGKSYSTVNVHLSALKFLFTRVLKKRLLYNVTHARIPKRLPVVLSKGEIRRLLRTVDNEKHRLVLAMMYGCGLRVGEAVKIKYSDFDLERRIGWVREGKGGRDRAFVIPHCVSLEGEGYVFPGNNGHLSTSSVRKIIKRAAKKAGIRKDVHPHTLRHSFATHLIEGGYPMFIVQQLLGHASPDTTQTYIHTAIPRLQVKSPLDSLDVPL